MITLTSMYEYFDSGSLGNLGRLLVVLSYVMLWSGDARIVRKCNDGFRRFYDLGRVMF